ncbi:DUF317 domain-containing protein [Streptomyces sp. SID5473]|uniref:DUF317 domain-containing protein n=2 Tax=Streptomyces TaxID=1883 RepID=A0A7G3UR63_STRT9|nr:hypothetical protein B7R87_24190 [Streptomyces tsukubensis]MYS67841.1 DUF317 domain-containing protein [Streptomyces sp. SID5473]QKM71490.1 DUF317 domain-containing protein [Streptomyces tsukubensis NRRL18488]TAI42197.1 DUF317 domain-containing protein [Streptomyces tsukubensis]
MFKYGRREKPQVNEGIPVPVTYSALALPRPAKLHPLHTPDTREWPTGCDCAGPVLALLEAHGWTRITDPDANVHCTSPDGAMYVGFLPEAPAARHGDLWHIRALDLDGAPVWQQTFPSGIPPQAVAGFLAGLIATPSALCAHCS